MEGGGGVVWGLDIAVELRRDLHIEMNAVGLLCATPAVLDPNSCQLWVILGCHHQDVPSFFEYLLQRSSLFAEVITSCEHISHVTYCKIRSKS